MQTQSLPLFTTILTQPSIYNQIIINQQFYSHLMKSIFSPEKPNISKITTKHHRHTTQLITPQNHDYKHKSFIQSKHNQKLKTEATLKDTSVNKNIYKYRDIIANQNNSTLLPFLGSLRQQKLSKYKMQNIDYLIKATEQNPQSMHLTNRICFSQLVRKTNCDFENPNRVAQFYNIWNCISDSNTKANVNFQSGLRKYEIKKQQNKKPFCYLNSRIQTKTEIPTYLETDIICKKLKKLVKIQKRYSMH